MRHILQLITKKVEKLVNDAIVNWKKYIYKAGIYYFLEHFQHKVINDFQCRSERCRKK